ncbi:MAG: hypothetical protein JXR19_03305 [Bacteroidia bacterium]
MKTKFISVPALLILFASIQACMPKPEKKGVETNHYEEQITQNHLIIREKIEGFNKQIPQLRDSQSFFQGVITILPVIDSIMFNSPRPEPITASDSVYSQSSQRLFMNYQELLHKHYIELFSIYHNAGDELNVQEQMKVDSIWEFVMTNDKYAVDNYIRTGKLDSTAASQFQALK